MKTNSGTGKVKYTKDGVEAEAEFSYSLDVAESMADVASILRGKLTEDEQKADNVDELVAAKAVDYVNQILVSNARQASRAAFLATLEGPDKAIAAMAKKLAAVKGISLEDATKQIRAIVG